MNGVLQPLSGVLEKLDLPTPQKQEHVVIPDDAHPFQAPGPTDQRGICPTLNALANHGYLSRDGVSSTQTSFLYCLHVTRADQTLDYKLRRSR